MSKQQTPPVMPYGLILKQLGIKGFAGGLNVSEMLLRRDFVRLTDKELHARIHGGGAKCR